MDTHCVQHTRRRVEEDESEREECWNVLLNCWGQGGKEDEHGIYSVSKCYNLMTDQAKEGLSFTPRPLRPFSSPSFRVEQRSLWSSLTLLLSTTTRSVPVSQSDRQNRGQTTWRISQPLFLSTARLAPDVRSVMPPYTPLHNNCNDSVKNKAILLIVVSKFL